MSLLSTSAVSLLRKQLTIIYISSRKQRRFQSAYSSVHSDDDFLDNDWSIGEDIYFIVAVVDGSIDGVRSSAAPRERRETTKIE